MVRTFTEAEAQRVFARIAEQQRAADTPAGGLSLDDLEEAARAAGLDPSLVASAAAELDAPISSKTLLGAPVAVSRQRLIRGTLSDETWETMVAAARAEFGQSGVAGQLGRMREWTLSSSSRRTTRLALEPVGRDTRLVLTQSVRNETVGFTIAGAIQALMAVGFGIAALAGVDPEFWIPVVLFSAVAVLMLGGSQIGLRVWERRQARRFSALLDRLDLLARDAAPRDAASDERPAGRIDPALLDAEPLAAPLRGAFDAATDDALDSAGAPRRRDRA